MEVDPLKRHIERKKPTALDEEIQKREAVNVKDYRVNRDFNEEEFDQKIRDHVTSTGRPVLVPDEGIIDEANKQWEERHKTLKESIETNSARREELVNKTRALVELHNKILSTVKENPEQDHYEESRYMEALASAIEINKQLIESLTEDINIDNTAFEKITIKGKTIDHLQN